MSENTDDKPENPVHFKSGVVIYTHFGGRELGDNMNGFDTIIRNILDQYQPSETESDITVTFEAESVKFSIEKKTHPKRPPMDEVEINTTI